MRRITVTLTLLVDSGTDDNELLKALYDHNCDWEFNTEGTVEFTSESIVKED